MAVPLSFATTSGPGSFPLAPTASTLPAAAPSSSSYAVPGALVTSPLLTRILELRNFHADLKTRDIQAVFQAWEDERGGFKVKWVDDNCVYVVFADPAVAKKAYLARLLHPHPGLKNAPGKRVQIRPYDGANVNAILASVANRPRSRLNGGTHARNGSSIGSISSLASIPEPNTINPPLRRGFHQHHGHSTSTTSTTSIASSRGHHQSTGSLGGFAGLPAKPVQSVPSFGSGTGTGTGTGTGSGAGAGAGAGSGPSIPNRFSSHRSIPSSASSSSSSTHSTHSTTTSTSRWAKQQHDPDETITSLPTLSAS